MLIDEIFIFWNQMKSKQEKRIITPLVFSKKNIHILVNIECKFIEKKKSEIMYSETNVSEFIEFFLLKLQFWILMLLIFLQHTFSQHYQSLIDKENSNQWDL